MKSGDKVKVVRSVKNCQCGWSATMENFVGSSTIFEIDKVHPHFYDHVYLKDSVWVWPISALEIVAEPIKIETFYKVGSMEFDTHAAAKDHLIRKKLDSYISRCGGEEKFVNFIMNNSKELIEILKEI